MPSAEDLLRAYRSLEDRAYLSEVAGRLRSQRRYLRLLGQYTDRTPGRLLDVGCSAGLFLELAAAQGWSVFGVEPSTWLAHLAQKRFGSRVFNTSIEDIGLATESFEAITLWDVLEHVRDPGVVLRKTAGLLKPGGILALNVPDIGSIIAKSLGPRWPLLLPEHLHYFTRRSLRLLVEQNGFVVLGFHLHWVCFTIGYVLSRLEQHQIPGTAVAISVTRQLGLNDLGIPLLMGEITLVASKR